MANALSIGRRWEAYHPTKGVWFWSCAGCVAATIVVGFMWGGWVTGGTAAKDSVAASHTAVVAALAPICVERFRSQPDAVVKSDALLKINTWERSSLIEKSGFATMPGSKMADSDVARACAEILAATPPKS